MSTLPRIMAPRRSDVLGYKYVTPIVPPPPDDLFHKDHAHWQYIDKGIDLLDYDKTDQELLIRKFKQMAFKQFQPYDNNRRLIEYAFDAGYSHGIKATSTFLEKLRGASWVDIEKYRQELAATENRLLNYPEFELYKNPIEASRVIKSSFDAGYYYAIEEAFMPTSLIRSAVGSSHVMNPDKYIAAKKALLPKNNFKTYKQILFEILDNARNASLAAQADAEARAKTWRGTITSGLSSLGSRVKARLLSLPGESEYAMTDLLGGRSRRHRAKRVVSKKTTRCRRKSGRGRRHCK